MGCKRLTKSFSIMLKSVLAALIAGASMALINVVIEIMKDDPLLKFNNFYLIALWHMLVWLVFGFVLGIIQTIYFILKEKRVFINEALQSYIYLYVAFLLIIIGYLNIYILRSFSSSVWKLSFLLTALILLFFIKIKYNLTRKGKSLLILIIQVIIIIFSLIFSYALDSGYLKNAKKSRAIIKEENYRPFNVIILVLDSVRADHLSCYGYERKTTPNIDKIASEGVLFKNAFANSSHTAESVPALLTSTYPSTHNVRLGMLGSQTTRVPKDLIMLPTIFKSHGYKTALFSVGVPISSVFGFDRDIDAYFEPQKNILDAAVLAKLLDRVPSKIFYKKKFLINFSYSLFKSKFSLESTTPKYVIQKVISWLSDTRNTPFFLYVHLFGGHDPYDPPEEFRTIFDPDYLGRPVTKHPERAPLMYPLGKQNPVSNRELFNMVALYDSEILYHDRYVGILLDYLKTANLINNTIVILTSDHGEEFYDHCGWGHIYSLFDELIYVPLIFYCPDLIAKGKKINELIAHVDLFPTILSLCGISNFLKKFPFKIEGIDMSDLLLNENHTTKRKYIFSEVNVSKDIAACCLRTEIFKAIKVKVGNTTKKMFFDLIDDPNEKDDIYREGDSNIDNFFRELEMILKYSKEKSFKIHKINLNDRIKEQLKALGYLK